MSEPESTPIFQKTQLEMLGGLSKTFHWHGMTASDCHLARAIVNRVRQEVRERGWLGMPENVIAGVYMDLLTVHTHGTPLDLQAMLQWPDGEDVLDAVTGIGTFIDRNTGQLREGYVPKFALKKC